LVTFFAWFAVFFTGRYPKSFFEFSESVLRWTVNVQVYHWLLRDEYPPFSGADGRYPVHFSVRRAEHQNQILALFRIITVIPAMFVFFFVSVAAVVVVVLGWWAILFTGNMPRGFFGFLEGTIRWNARINAYYFLLTDAYPPFGFA
jgi:hypothetical protein